MAIYWAGPDPRFGLTSMHAPEPAFLCRQPAGRLGAFVERLWDWQTTRGAFRLERILPSASAQLIVNLAEDETRTYDEALRCTRRSAAALDGPAWRGFSIDTDEQVAVVGAVLRPGAASALFGERMDAVANGCVDVEDLVSCGLRSLRARLLEAGTAQRRLCVLECWLLECCGERQPDPRVASLLAALDRCPDLSVLPVLAERFGISPRRLGERFRQEVGMSPKRYLRLGRFRQVVARVHGRIDVDWAALAADGGFADQSHLCNEFRAFSGLTPGDYLRAHGPFEGHVPIDGVPPQA